MAGFETHIGFSTVLGVGYGALGYYWGLPVESCLLSAGLCSLSGMLPDLDSDSGVPVRETMSLTAAVVPMLLIERVRELGWSHEIIVLAAAAMYLLVRFGVAALFQRFTVHRGMWHSIPACLTAGFLAFLLVSGYNLDVRLFKAGAVVLGFLSHLVLDEIWSFGIRGGRLQVKKSFGTALKFWGKDSWANFSVYAKLAIAAFLAVGDPWLMHRMGHEVRFGQQTAQEWFEKTLKTAGAQPLPNPPAPNGSDTNWQR